MLKRIVHNSEKLCTFVEPLTLKLSQPQRRHLLNLAAALLVCEDEKTLADLQRQFIMAPDASNMADFLRISPWKAADVRAALRAQQVAWLVAEAERHGAPRVLYLNIDDSLGEKAPATRHLEPVAQFYDHTGSTPKRPRYKNAFCSLVGTLCQFTPDNVPPLYGQNVPLVYGQNVPRGGSDPPRQVHLNTYE